MKIRKIKRAFERIKPNGRQMVIGVPFLWLFLFFALPFLIVLKISFAEPTSRSAVHRNLQLRRRKAADGPQLRQLHFAQRR